MFCHTWLLRLLNVRLKRVNLVAGRQTGGYVGKPFPELYDSDSDSTRSTDSTRFIASVPTSFAKVKWL